MRLHTGSSAAEADCLDVAPHVKKRSSYPLDTWKCNTAFDGGLNQRFQLEGAHSSFAKYAIVSKLCTTKQPPNLIVALVDHLGYANVGFHNMQQRSPVIDRLAQQEGVILGFNDSVWKPTFHIRPGNEATSMNDPCGPMFFNGMHRTFCQDHIASGTAWGHVASVDGPLGAPPAGHRRGSPE